MSEPEFPQLPKDQQWEYATLAAMQTAGLFGTIGAKHSVQWTSTLEDEGDSKFEVQMSDILYIAGRAGWELVSSTTLTTNRGGNTHEIVFLYVFKQRRALNEEQELAQLIDSAALLKRTNKYIKQQNTSLAMNAINRAFALHPQHREHFYLARAKIFLTRGDDTRALEDLDKAVEANQNYADAYVAAGNVCYRRKEYEKAINGYTNALQCIQDDRGGPNSVMISEILYCRGLSYRELGRVKEAARDFKDHIRGAKLDTSKRVEIEGWIKDLERRR